MGETLPRVLVDTNVWISAVINVTGAPAPTGSLHLCRDPDDDILLETALVGGARYFVSRDDDVKRDQELMARLRERGSRCCQWPNS